MPYRQKLSTKAKLRRLGYVFFFTLIGGVLVYIVYSVLEPGTGPRTPAAPAVELSERERERFHTESRELEARFEERISEDEEADEEAVAILREAYERQRRATAGNPHAPFSEQQRLDRLAETLSRYEGDLLARRVDELEARAEERREAGEYGEAIELLREAQAVQEHINRQMRQSPHSSTARAASLGRRITTWQAEPIIERSRQAEREAERAVREERWADALALYREARAGQVRINEEFSRTPFTSRSRVGDLEAEIASLRTLEIRAEISALAAEGSELLEAGRYREAAGLFGEAAERQRHLNREFAGSRYASSDAVREFESARQTALSGELAGELSETVADMERSLRERRPEEAARLVGDARRLIGTIEEEFPLSESVDEAAALRIRYLHSVRDRLAAVHEDVYGYLREIPGGGVELYAVEVPQRLFFRVMNRNPSRNEGASLPVDSVNREEAEEFCRRLSWLLGRPVRLPTREEFLRASGELEAAELDETSWHLRNSGGESQPVGTREPNRYGFYDLTGNVAEWLATPGEDGRALVAGGSYDDDLAEAAAPPIETVSASQRSRTVGFRFVVEAGN